jgi:hypothetical protein
MVYGANKNKNLVINNYHRSIFKIVYNILLLSVTTTLIYELSCSILLQKVNQKEHSIHSISKKLLRGTRSPHSLGGGVGRGPPSEDRCNVGVNGSQIPLRCQTL